MKTIRVILLVGMIALCTAATVEAFNGPFCPPGVVCNPTK